MRRISGPFAILTGLFLVMVGLACAFSALVPGSGQIPGWMVSDLIFATSVGAAFVIWGAGYIRRRELALHGLEPVRIRR